MAGPAAFMSYVRFDDAHEDGQLTAFREWLAGEIRIQTWHETGIEIRDDGDPTVRGNRINRNTYDGVWVHDRGKGVIEDNDLTENGLGAVVIESDCQPNVAQARNKE